MSVPYVGVGMFHGRIHTWISIGHTLCSVLSMVHVPQVIASTGTCNIKSHVSLPVIKQYSFRLEFRSTRSFSQQFGQYNLLVMYPT